MVKDIPRVAANGVGARCVRRGGRGPKDRTCDECPEGPRRLRVAQDRAVRESLEVPRGVARPK